MDFKILLHHTAFSEELSQWLLSNCSLCFSFIIWLMCINCVCRQKGNIETPRKSCTGAVSPDKECLTYYVAEAITYCSIQNQKRLIESPKLRPITVVSFIKVWFLKRNFFVLLVLKRQEFCRKKCFQNVKSSVIRVKAPWFYQ